MIVWECKIGSLEDIDLPEGADFPMRQAIKEAYRKLTGKEIDFCFTGWGGKLTKMELSVIKTQDGRQVNA